MNVKSFKALLPKEMFFQSLVSLVIRIIAALSGFLFSALVARNLGAEQSGYFFLAFSIINILSVVCCLGLDQSVLYFTGRAFATRNWSLVRSILVRSVVVAFIVGSILSLSVFLAADLAGDVFKKPELTPVLRAMSFAIVGLALVMLLGMSLQGLRRVTSSIFLVNVCGNVCLIIFLYKWPAMDLQDLALIYTFVSVIVVFLGFGYWWLVRPRLRSLDAKQVDWNEISRYSRSLFVVVLIAQLIQWSSQLIAGIWVEPADLARLAMAQRTAMLTSFVLLAVNLVVAPRFASMHQDNDLAGIQELALSSTRLMTLLTLPVVLIMIFFPGLLMGFFGDDFVAGTYLLRILVVGQLINVITGPVNNLLIMTGNADSMKSTMIMAGLIVVGCALILIPLYGVIGAAIATALAVSAQNLIAVWYVRRRLSINIFTAWLTFRRK